MSFGNVWSYKDGPAVHVGSRVPIVIDWKHSSHGCPRVYRVDTGEELTNTIHIRYLSRFKDAKAGDRRKFCVMLQPVHLDQASGRIAERLIKATVIGVAQ